mmetsp:Transcript_3665/g.7813  ORF Transcript_3665/g.7813 Transcript_3665/m.7813 type:complete len:231 (+) Transcript_3665:873-1565(+)
MLARRAAAKVVAGDEDLGADAVAAGALTVFGAVEHKVGDVLGDALVGAGGSDIVGVVVTHLGESSEAKPRALDGFQVLLWRDHVRVDVRNVEWCGDALEVVELGHSSSAPRALRLADDRSRRLDRRIVLRLLHRRDLIAPRNVGQLHAADVGELASDGGRCSHGRRAKVRAAADTLPAFEIAVGRRGAPLLISQLVRVHGETHRAAGLAPFEAGVLEDDVETLVLRLLLH